ncbi:MAG: gamma-glutamyl-gamma-aminobutyrate hydrolase family protein [Candidatus Cloacimonetes bacterium]|nr:gamma-glutamyl-gamma-aminobutyrate hydrolase family protein [Candidatus Cloacimonadota bacterium]MCF7813144.1 gamma-glutamyl-gamma-aminobutyrate hydrolase family protein [Candidatus Cloacimonadota bacterium]MCF7867592.1 gamma-glutamyl-gamma-aminobutyrate hydrolase family protein [Candidatus Cloacimonadota bacterium]MCF7883133.1 gamma-glutamyl-gamma-aminobutyrate hydrolase family protein [Candidatus Cloacimonadota bacterium]
MILILNTIIDQKARDHFTNVIAERITFGRSYFVMTLEDNINLVSEFSHLLLSGSELSASNGSEWDGKIFTVIEHFLNHDKPILGICHGHQIIAKAVCGDEAVCKSANPEFGWKQMKITKNRIFKKISQPIFLESRYDEVCFLDEKFEIIAINESSKIQAFQMKNKPVWGIQFHPEMLWEDGNKMLENHFLQNPDDRIFYKNEMEDINLINYNLNIFKNFWDCLR